MGNRFNPFREFMTWARFQLGLLCFVAEFHSYAASFIKYLKYLGYVISMLCRLLQSFFLIDESNLKEKVQLVMSTFIPCLGLKIRFSDLVQGSVAWYHMD